MTMRRNSLYSTWNDLIAEECPIICASFRKVQQTVDALDGPQHGNQALFSVNFRTQSLSQLIS
jgi:hypothetical protein